MITPGLFDAFFEQVHGNKPFPWQTELAAQVLQGRWPASIALPTASGKTALIDIALFGLAAGAAGAARRIFFVVDRRIVVDEAARRAETLRDILAKPPSGTPARAVADALWALAGPDADPEQAPLCVATLRGGTATDSAWTRSPLLPTVCCSTVDQIGSSLLFRAYGSRSPHNWPIRAALAANDSLIIVDEAHISQPFVETVEAVSDFRQWAERHAAPGGLRVIEMSATPRATSNVFREKDADWSDQLLSKRWNASKPARLVLVAAPEEDGGFEPLIDAAVAEASSMAKSGARAIGVVVNRVATARRIHARLKREEDSDAELLTGRSRPFDRQALWSDLEPKVRFGRASEPSRPIFVVATQCIEVGADIDFDALVTEIASIDALEQRFGRLNRAGRDIPAPAAIIAQKDQTASKYEDKVYGGAMPRTGQWLKEHATKAKGRRPPVIDMSVRSLRSLLTTGPDRHQMCMARPHAPVLFPQHLDRLAETSPQPATEPDPALFLHGPQSGHPDVYVVWRADLDQKNTSDWRDLVARVPPWPEEMLPVPLWDVRNWLSDEPTESSDVADIEGTADNRQLPRTRRAFLNWSSRQEDRPDEPKIRPGDIIVVPCSYGGCDQWGWNPGSTEPVTDCADLVSAARRHPTLRLDNPVVAQWRDAGPECLRIVDELRTAETNTTISSLLGQLAKWAPPPISNIAHLLGKGRLRPFRMPSTDENGIRQLTAVAGRGELEQESNSASFTENVELARHLEQCAHRALTYATALGLPDDLAETIRLAARYHDIGKADPRFQSWLRDGMPVSSSDELLAKSKSNGRDRNALRRARERAGYPRGGRHEVQSVALLSAFSGLPYDIDGDLLLHLVASHHGRCRPFAPVVHDSAPVTVEWETLTASSRHRLESAASGVSERFWRLTRRYGWWGLAFLETLVRLADQRQSEFEETREDEKEESLAAASN
ncbi:MAG TPA: type I-U CRISPR-associated helicase/endonuclease Cas3 [Bryobacteraceae bacterium]|nr:type I-U CRISPR-associated helicase/endonuclease Cas3 [Bryobacteraceae bacterium]